MSLEGLWPSCHLWWNLIAQSGALQCKIPIIKSFVTTMIAVFVVIIAARTSSSSSRSNNCSRWCCLLLVFVCLLSHVCFITSEGCITGYQAEGRIRKKKRNKISTADNTQGCPTNFLLDTLTSWKQLARITQRKGKWTFQCNISYSPVFMFIFRQFIKELLVSEKIMGFFLSVSVFPFP